MAFFVTAVRLIGTHERNHLRIYQICQYATCVRSKRLTRNYFFYGDDVWFCSFDADINTEITRDITGISQNRITTSGSSFTSGVTMRTKAPVRRLYIGFSSFFRHFFVIISSIFFIFPWNLEQSFPGLSSRVCMSRFWTNLLFPILQILF